MRLASEITRSPVSPPSMSLTGFFSILLRSSGRRPLPYAFLAICSMIAEANSEQRTSRAPAICRAKS